MWTGGRQQPTRRFKTSRMPGPDAELVHEPDAGVSVHTLESVVGFVNFLVSAFMIPPFDVRSSLCCNDGG